MIARHLCAIGGLALVLGCAPVRGPDTTWIATHLLFGFSKPDATLVTHAQWQRFVDEQVSPRMRSGFTVIETTGQWYDEDAGLSVREPGRMLLVLHRGSDNDERNIAQVADEYKRQFQQQSVLRWDSPARVTEATSTAAEPAR